MLLKLSEYESIPGFNKVTSAIIKENNLPIFSLEDFGRLFPDIANPKNSYLEFFESLEILKNTDVFINTLLNFDKNKNICVFGDYDGDGVMATTIMVHSLSKLGYNVFFEVPNRLEDGYGLQKNVIEKIVNDKNTSLIITVDNGISGKEFVEYAKSLNCEIIITDHHLPTTGSIPENVPIIDPKYTGDSFSDICGAFVALKLCYALYKHLNADLSIIESVAPLAGIATITDMMPVIKENRDLIHLTLNAIEYTKYNNSKLPLYKLLNSLGGYNYLRSPNTLATEELIAFYVGPAINAVSRVNGDVNPLIEKIISCFNKPWTYIPSYTNVNFTRQKMTNELLSNFKLDDRFKESSVFVYNNSEYEYNIKGVLGLIANKISNKYKVVSLIGCYKTPDIIEFSGRSTLKYDLHKGIERIKQSHPEFCLEGGGHAQAMGIRLNNNFLEEFRNALELDISKNSSPYNQNIFEWEEEFEEEIVETIGSLQPYGASCQKLKFQYSGVFVNYDYDLKMAQIGDYKFKMYISPLKIEGLLGTDLDVIFSISYNSSEGPIFTVINE